MFRILVVEDGQDTLEQLQKLIKEVFPQSQVETATNADEALSLIRASVEQPAWPYDAVITDFLIPQVPGGAQDLHREVFEAIRTCLPHAVMAGITAYASKEDVSRELSAFHKGPGLPAAFGLSKAQSDWPIELVERLAAFLYGLPIERKIDELFGRSFIAGVPAARDSHGPGTGVSMTHELAALTQDIEEHWHFLDSSLQDKIRRIFVVEELDDGLRVGLYKPSG